MFPRVLWLKGRKQDFAFVELHERDLSGAQARKVLFLSLLPQSLHGLAFSDPNPHHYILRPPSQCILVSKSSYPSAVELWFSGKPSTA